MENIVPYLSATSTILGLVFFVGIVWWAWSSKRQSANDESANLPFDLPDEYKKD
ncbi:cbb3-type cytochrome oxidase subunit 3 [Polynucleobacter sp. MWH-Spelu-300-X4]|jgi:cytochrome c oxidase cbb3-type subunit 4|uniref:cbb3-type cytochrome oxidase subunit 3 n=1 Tax=Polynucleobacter sp. MWH-Spelu-300-X4 TaxID=2689109 RepID=UPI0035303636